MAYTAELMAQYSTYFANSNIQYSTVNSNAKQNPNYSAVQCANTVTQSQLLPRLLICSDIQGWTFIYLDTYGYILTH